jgi:hypothetical protein
LISAHFWARLHNLKNSCGKGNARRAGKANAVKNGGRARAICRIKRGLWPSKTASASFCSNNCVELLEQSAVVPNAIENGAPLKIGDKTGAG